MLQIVFASVAGAGRTAVRVAAVTAAAAAVRMVTMMMMMMMMMVVVVMAKIFRMVMMMMMMMMIIIIMMAAAATDMMMTSMMRITRTMTKKRKRIMDMIVLMRVVKAVIMTTLMVLEEGQGHADGDDDDDDDDDDLRPIIYVGDGDDDHGCGYVMCSGASSSRFCSGRRVPLTYGTLSVPACIYMDSSFLRNLSPKKLHNPSAVGLLLAVMLCTSRNFQQAACKPFAISRLLALPNSLLLLSSEKTS